MMGYIEGYITSNSTEQEIAQIVENICMVVPSALRSVCTGFIDEYAPAVIEALVARVPPSAVCAKIGLCSSQIEQIPSADNGLECSMCTLVMGYIEGQITSNSTEQEITEIVTHVCDVIPKAVRPVVCEKSCRT